jgi:glucose-6-phosphate isomerase
MTLKLDYSNMMISPGGISADAWRGAGPQFKTAKSGFEKLTRSGEVGFVGLPGDSGLLQQVTRYADSALGKYDDVVILGIGGSALGPIALRTALRPSGWNMLDDRARGGFPRLHVLDNVDPETIASLLGRLKFERTLFIVTSKSGGTAETMAQFVIVHEKLVAARLDLKNHLVFVTDPSRSELYPRR